jgi:hypothetical protein
MLRAEEILDGKARILEIISLGLSRFREGKLTQEYNVV